MESTSISRRTRDAFDSVVENSPGYVGLVYAVVLVWGLGDIVSTYAALSASGSLSLEANPWMRSLLGRGPMFFAAVKGAVVLYAGVVLLLCRSVVETVPGHRLWFFAVLAVGKVVVASNLAVAMLH